MYIKQKQVLYMGEMIVIKVDLTNNSGQWNRTNKKNLTRIMQTLLGMALSYTVGDNCKGKWTL